MGKVRASLACWVCAALASGALAQDRQVESAALSAAATAIASTERLSAGASLDLASALSQAEARSPAMAASRLEADAMRYDADQAGVRPNPELGLDVEDATRRQRTVTVSLSQRLELGGKRAARVQAAQKAREVAEVQTQQ